MGNDVLTQNMERGSLHNGSARQLTWCIILLLKTHKEYKSQLINNRLPGCVMNFYPTLGCNIQGLRAMGLSVQYWPRWFQDFLAIWLAVPFGASGAHLGICTLLVKKSFLCVKQVVSVWNKVFPKENSSCEIFMVTNCPYAGINKWMEKSNTFWKNGTCRNTIVKPQTVRYRLIK